ncbi:MAG: acyloxyacyl hydrolase [Chlamydiae bacterium]|nr:acyloxyacyl hydrolase [Chlamydiota bacterium]
MKYYFFLALAALSFHTTFSQASTLKNTTFDNPNLLTISFGVFDIIKNPYNAIIQLEYKSTLTNYKKARPILGLFTTHHGSTYLFGGIGYDIFFGPHIALTPSLCPGLYYAGGGKKLHFPLEFRSCAELSYVLKNKSRIGAQFYHISNASLGTKNPGVEALLVSYSIAL